MELSERAIERSKVLASEESITKFVNNKKFKQNSVDNMINEMIDDEWANNIDLKKELDDYLNEGLVKENVYVYWKTKKE